MEWLNGKDDEGTKAMRFIILIKFIKADGDASTLVNTLWQREPCPAMVYPNKRNSLLADFDPTECSE